MVFGRKKKKKEKKERSDAGSEQGDETTLLDPRDDDSLLAAAPTPEIDEEEMQAAAAWTGASEQTPTTREAIHATAISPAKQRKISRQQESTAVRSPAAAKTPLLKALLIEIQRKIEARMDNQHQIKVAKVQGQIVVKNQSQFDRIWDISLKFKESKGITIKPEYNIPELQPNASWQETFEIKKGNQAQFLPIKFEEFINTSSNKDQSISVFIHGKSNPTTLLLRVHVLQEMEKVTLYKKIPTFFSRKPTIRVSKGEVKVNDQGELTWEIADVYKDTVLEATISDNVTISDTQPKSTEPTRIEFVSKSEDDFIEIGEVRGLVKNKSWINSDELDEAPGTWENRLVFQNESACVVKLLEVEVKDDKKVYLKERLDVMEELIHPNTEWISDPWTSESRGFPSFNYKVLFTVLPETRYLMVGTVDIEPLSISVAKINVERTYNTLDLRSFDKNPLEATFMVENTGTTPISEIVFIEKLPEHFIIPDDVTVKLKKKESTNAKKLDYGDYTLVFYPDDREADHPHEMKFTLNVPLQPNYELIVVYRPTAEKPPKGKSYEVAGAVEVRLTPNDPPIEMSLPRDPIVFRVVHQRYRVSFGKQVREGQKPGEYHVSVWFMNRSDIAMEDIVLQDILPESFDIVKNSHSSIMKKAKITEGTALRWEFKKIEPGEEITVEYVLKGSGNYSPSKIQLT